MLRVADLRQSYPEFVERFLIDTDYSADQHYSFLADTGYSIDHCYYSLVELGAIESQELLKYCQNILVSLYIY